METHLQAEEHHQYRITPCLLFFDTHEPELVRQALNLSTLDGKKILF